MQQAAKRPYKRKRSPSEYTHSWPREKSLVWGLTQAGALAVHYAENITKYINCDVVR